MRVRATGFRTTWMSVLVTLLLSVWPASSACAMMCDLAQGTSCCGASSAAQTSMAAMPGMERVSAPDTTHRLDASCVAPLCAPAPALQTVPTRSLVRPTLNLDGVLSGVFSPLPGGEPSTAAVRGPPLVGLASPVSLRTLIRV